MHNILKILLRTILFGHNQSYAIQLSSHLSDLLQIRQNCKMSLEVSNFLQYLVPFLDLLTENLLPVMTFIDFTLPNLCLLLRKSDGKVKGHQLGIKWKLMEIK